MPTLKIVRQVTPTESMFHKSEAGQCAATKMKGLKLAPLGCSKVCRGSDGLECCPPVACANFEGSHVLALVEP